MCIAIYKPEGVTIPDEHLEESFLSNPDGAGFAVAYPRKEPLIRKGFFTLEEFKWEFAPYSHLAALVHFRIATSGGINAEMCHPFPLCGGQYAMIHNGIFNIKPHKGKSDTATFADSVLTPILAKGVPHTSTAFKFLVEQAIGRSNKMLIMDQYGKVAYFNEKEGYWVDKCWYSNYSYKPVVKTTLAWTEDDWKNWGKGSGRKGVLLNEIRLCAFCHEPVEEYSNDLYCEECLKDWIEDESGYSALK